MSLKLGLRDRRVRATLLVLSAVGVIASAGVLYRAGTRASAPARRSPDIDARRRSLLELHSQALRMFQAGHYSAAAQRFEAGWREASRFRQGDHAVRFLNNLGACRVAAFRYREGMAAYLAARDLARKMGDWDAAAGLAFNISALYLEMGEVNSARQAAESGLALLEGRPHPEYRAKLLIQLARLRARGGDLEAALRLFGEALQEAERRGDSATEALAWNQAGYELLRSGELEGAEQALLEAYRRRRLARDKAVVLSYRTLGLLRLAQGDLDSASHLLDQAIALVAGAPRLIPSWQLHHDRGRVRMAQGRLAEALADLRASVDSARRWRPEVLPSDPVRISLEAGLQEVYSSFIEAGNRLYFAGGDPRLMQETFEAAEENRAYSLRALIAAPGEWHEKLPPEHGEALARLREAEVGLLVRDSPSLRQQVRELHHRLVEIEARTGLEFSKAAGEPGARAGLLERAQGALGAGEALLSFHLAEPRSYLWGITRDQVQLERLPARSQLRRDVEQFVDAVRGGSAEAPALGGKLYEALLGGLRRGIRGKAHWLLTLDDVLFELPFAALPEGPGFVIERHSLQVVPSAHLLVSARAKPEPAGKLEGALVGVGDPIYNTADPRWRNYSAGSNGRTPSLELPRLPGSGREVRACARLWNSLAVPPVLLEGPEATREAVFRSLEGRPAVLHFAAHVVATPEKRALIALSLLPSGAAELLSPLEIAHLGRSSQLVVLSGCSSAQAEARPGTGLMGLTRAWLAAGADTVVATRWPTTDDTGELFASFYRQLRPPGQPVNRPAAALQRAQLDMLASRSWRAHPNYWAAYVAVGRQ